MGLMGIIPVESVAVRFINNFFLYLIVKTISEREIHYRKNARRFDNLFKLVDDLEAINNISISMNFKPGYLSNRKKLFL